MSKAGIDRLAFKRQHPKDALMYASQRLVAHKTLQCLDTQRELPKRQRALCAQSTVPEPAHLLGPGVLRAVDDTEILPASALNCGLHQPTRAVYDEVKRLDNHAFTALLRQMLPPGRARRFTGRICDINNVVGGSQ